MHFIIYYRINSNLVESSNEIKEKKNQLRNHLLYLLVWPFGLSYRWSSEVPDIRLLRCYWSSFLRGQFTNLQKKNDAARLCRLPKQELFLFFMRLTDRNF